MRKEFANFFKEQLKVDSNLIVLLGDIGVGSFLDGEELSKNVYNVGINEQAMVSFASGISDTGKTVVLHTISPFLVERAYEQIKLACSYNEIKLILVSANGPFDYSKLGPTHHCPADVPILSQINNMHLFVPGNLDELEASFSLAMNSNRSSYIRLTSKVSLARASPLNDFLKLSYEAEQGKNLPVHHRALVAIGEAQKYVEERKLFENYDIYAPRTVSLDYDFSELANYHEITILEPYSSSVLGVESEIGLNIKRQNFGNKLSKKIVVNQGWDRFDDVLF